MDRYLGARRGLLIATMPLRRISRSEIRGFGNQDINELLRAARWRPVGKYRTIRQGLLKSRSKG
jgi:hypothetical protein